MQWRLSFHAEEPVKTGRFSTELQLENGLRISPKSRRHQPRSRSDTAGTGAATLPPSTGSNPADATSPKTWRRRHGGKTLVRELNGNCLTVPFELKIPSHH